MATNPTAGAFAARLTKDPLHRVSITQQPTVPAIKDRGPRLKAYKPRRFTGPFWTGSDLSQIQLEVAGAAVLWYFGDYFADNPDAPHYDPFFPGKKFPSEAAPLFACHPGAAPNGDGLAKLTFGLYQVRYSRRYGGSVQLCFQALSDTGYELRAGQVVWDLVGLEFNIFVGPVANAFENAGFHNSCPVACEFRHRGVIAYALTIDDNAMVNPPILPQALPDPARDQADAALRAVALAIMRRADSVKPARSFVLGFLTATFPDFLAAGLRVDGVCVTENAIAFHTHEPVPTVRVAMRVASGVNGTGIPILGDISLDAPPFKFRLNTSWTLGTSAGSRPGGARTDDIAGSEPGGTLHSSPLVTLLYMTVDEMIATDTRSITVTIGGKEFDDITGDDHFLPVTFSFELDHDAIIARAAAGAFGRLDDPGDQPLIVATPFAGTTEDPASNPSAILIMTSSVDLLGV